jgi:GNAT superfamily N-acetyltransferase
MYKIRLATLDDIDELVSLRLAFLEEVGSLLGEEADRREVGDAFGRYLRRKLPTGEFLAFVAADAETGEIVATSGLTFFERPPNGRNPAGVEAYLSNMYTIPGWRGKGLGAALVEAIVNHVKETPARRIWLHATEQGRRVYAKAGFVTDETEMELVW